MNQKKIKHLLSIGGHDPSGHAGVMADQEIWQNYGIQHQVVLTAVTAQSKNQFLSWEPVSLKLFEQQLHSVKNIWGVKIGMIATARHAQLVCDWLKKNRSLYVIWDPVWRSSTGAQLLKAKTFSPALKNLLKQCHGFTPNIPETEWILHKKLLKEKKSTQEALKSLRVMGAKKNRWVLVKGGHSLDKNFSNDWLDDGKSFIEFKAKRVKAFLRGTGCRLASAILAELYQGRDLEKSIKGAKRKISILFQSKQKERRYTPSSKR